MRARIIVTFILLNINVLVGCGHRAAEERNLNMNLNLPLVLGKDTELKPLSELRDGDLQKKLDAEIDKNGKWKKLIDNKMMAVGLVDLRDLNNIRFASINGDEIMYAASLPKIAVLLATADALEKGELKETPAIHNDMRLMISRSNNEATTRLIDLLGYDKIREVVTSPEYKLYDPEQGGGLWVGKRYAKTGTRVPEPIKGISHAATADQVCRFYYMLIQGKLVSYDRSKQMLDMMIDPEIHHKFVNSIEKIRPNAKLFRKSGTWKNYHADSILVWGENDRFILVGLLQDDDGERILRQLIYTVEDVLDECDEALSLGK
ncbi:serine hydrolase [Mangrovibacterium diazotrophicum]|uniref:beta-lactamase n=1 Tax=Mangrovibacterium diazotrophicum TaxID=1261403 RepID=A0A419W6Z6_9BACT|nr:serine hydrolase [Mangrovibacterium diazotrophicum]RKD91244.1 beta-lactamase class A [Mangrovibacterium diazotrophicum]